MAKEKENKRPNSRSSLLKSGCYASFYSHKDFVKIKPALTIDKVVFSFVKKGTSGSGFDIYVNVDDFDLLCDAILSKELQNDLHGSNQNKPAWEYTTGEKGMKDLKIYQGNNGIIINGFIKTTKQSISVPVTYANLRIMAKWHRRISNIYFEKMAQECIKAMESYSKYYEQNEEEEMEDIAETQDDAETTQNQQEKPSAQQQGKSENPAAQNTNSKPQSNDPNELFVLIKTSTIVEKYGSYGNYCFKGYTKNSRELTFIVTPTNISTIGEKRWNDFFECTRAMTGVACNIGYVKCKDKLLVTSIQSAADM